MNDRFEIINAAEHERLLADHGPLTDAVRNLVEAAILSKADSATIAEAISTIEAVTETLRADRHDRAPIRWNTDTDLPVVLANPVVGLANALAPPLVIHHNDEGCWSEFTLGAAYEGPMGWVHGGICAMVLDQLLGEVASAGGNRPRYTGTISCRYLRGTPLGALRAEAYVERTDGVKTFARGTLCDADGVTVEAEGVFITPAWARNAG